MSFLDKNRESQYFCEAASGRIRPFDKNNGSRRPSFKKIKFGNPLQAIDLNVSSEQRKTEQI